MSEGWSNGEGWDLFLVLVVVVDNRPATTAHLCLGRRGPQGATPSLFIFILSLLSWVSSSLSSTFSSSPTHLLLLGDVEEVAPQLLGARVARLEDTPPRLRRARRSSGTGLVQAMDHDGTLTDMDKSPKPVAKW
jgi:hypothetical protein